MNERWWERSACLLCDYGWVALLIVLLSLAAYLLRGWWPGSQNPAPVSTEVLSAATALPSIYPSPSSTSTAVQRSEFTDPQGEFRLSFPAEWSLEKMDDSTHQWILPQGLVMSVHSEPILSGETLEDFAQEVVTRLPYEVLRQEQIQIAGQPAIRQEVAYLGQRERIAVGYLLFYRGRKYQIGLAGLDGFSQAEQEQLIQEFEQTIATFSFIQP